MRSWPLILALSGAALSGALLAACATRDPMTAPPDWIDIKILEELRVITPLANETDTAGKFVIESAPKVETRNVRCVAAEDDAYTCSFESRVTPKGANAPPWDKRTERLERDYRGNWWFAKPASGA
jgi:hypothetical protein